MKMSIPQNSALCGYNLYLIVVILYKYIFFSNTDQYFILLYETVTSKPKTQLFKQSFV